MQYTIDAKAGGEYDVIVCGAGTAGVVAAISAGRQGAKVLLVERSFHVGGMLTEGNAGLTNFYRTYGAKYALLVIACDMGKTAIATAIGGCLFGALYQDWTLGVLITGLGCIIGHVFPVFYGFKGGKGILSGSILIIMLDWRIALVAWSIFLLAVVLTRYISLGSLLAAASVGVTSLFLYDRVLYIALTCLIAALVIWSHRTNVKRLISGTENKFKWHTGPSSTDESV